MKKSVVSEAVNTALQERMSVTASFEETVPYPEGKGERWMEIFQDNDYTFYYLSYILANTHVLLYMMRVFDKAGLKYDPSLMENITLLNCSADSYELSEEADPTGNSMRIGVGMGKKQDYVSLPARLYQGNWAIINSDDFGLSYVDFSSKEGVPTGRSSLYGYFLQMLFGERLDNRKIIIPMDAKFSSTLYKRDLGSRRVPTDKLSDEDLAITQEEFMEMLSVFGGFELTLECPPMFIKNFDSFTEKFGHLKGAEYNAALATMLANSLFLPKIRVKSIIEVPKGIFSYVCQREEPSLPLVWQWFQKRYAFSQGVKGALDPDPVRGLDSVVADTAGLRAVNKSAANGCIVTYDGEYLWVPNITNLDEYKSYIAKLEESVSTNEKGLQSFSATEADFPINQYLYTDWRLDVMIYSNTSGVLNTRSLVGAGRLKADHMLKMAAISWSTQEGASLVDSMVLAQNYLRKVKKSVLDFMKPEDFLCIIPRDRVQDFMSMSKDMSGVITALNACAVSSYNRKMFENPDSSSIVSFVGRIHYSMMVLKERAESNETVEVGDDDFDAEGTPDYSSGNLIYFSPALRFIPRMAAWIKENVKGNWLECIGDFSIGRLLRAVPGIIMFADYPEQRTLIKQDEEERKLYINPKLNPNYKPIPVPNIKDDMAFMPHQVVADAQLSSDPDNDVVHIEPGGGKTLLACLNILRKLAANKKVLVISPNYLIPNYIEDMLFASSGKANVFPITNSVYREYGEQKLYDAIMQSPPNTVFIVGLSVFSKGQNINYSYCGQPMVINQIVEFLRNIPWEEIWIDESHMLANPGSTRSGNAARLMSSAEKRRIMTGTFINGTMMDAYGQSKLLDPGTFGKEDSFTSTYGQQFRGSKVIKWQPNAEDHIRTEMRRNTGYIYIPQKEWAYMLPFKKEQFHNCELSDAQRTAYEAILREIIDEIKKDMEVNQALKSYDNGEGDDANIEMLLRAYLARVEMFLASCDLDELGRRVLKGKDLISPKSTVVNEILAEHFRNPETRDTKVLIFTSYRDSAKSIYEHLDPKYKKMAVHYEAERKDELIPIMKRDKSMRIVVGVEQSLNTGHNFQDFSRIIRIESIWNPGTLSQAESRIFRPNVKQVDNRKSIYLDWVVCDRTIDITKSARLIGKLISAAKFNAQGDTRYASIQDQPLVSMNLDNIFRSNSFNADLHPYLDSYQQLKKVEQEDFTIYREKNKDAKMVAIPNAGIIKGSAYYNVPYVPGMVLPFQSDLGLENLSDTALRYHVSIRALNEEVIGKPVHTEYGDGVITRASNSTISVKLDKSNKRVSVVKTAAFLKTKDIGDTRKAIISLVGLSAAKSTGPSKPVKENKVSPGKGADAPEDISTSQTKVSKKDKVEKPAKEKTSRNGGLVGEADNALNHKIQLFLDVFQGLLMVTMDTKDPDITDAVASKLKLAHSGDYYATGDIKNAKHLMAAIGELEDFFDIVPESMAMLEEATTLFNKGKSKLLNVEQADQMDIKNFFLMQRKKRKGKELFVYPCVMNGGLMLVAFSDGQPATKKLSRVKSPGVRWVEYEGFYFKMFAKVKEVKDFVDEVKESAGLRVTNSRGFLNSLSEVRLHSKTVAAKAKSDVNKRHKETK